MNLQWLKRISVAVMAVAFATVTVASAAGIAKKAQPAMINTYGMPKIIIDAGHGGFDGGASGTDGTVEKDINLLVSLKLRDMLMAMGFDVMMVRETDTGVHNGDEKTIREKKHSDLMNRFKLMEKHPDSIYLCIHQNFFPQGSSSGTQVFYSPNDERAKQLAQEIQSSVKLQLQPGNGRQIKKCTKDVYIIYHAKSPAVLVECGFLSNAAELKKLKDDTYQNRMAFSIACGMLNYVRAGRAAERPASVFTHESKANFLSDY